MATQLQHESLYIDEQIARIQRMNNELGKTQVEVRKLIVESQKITQYIRLATPQMFFQRVFAMAALIGAGAALAKLIA